MLSSVHQSLLRCCRSVRTSFITSFCSLAPLVYALYLLSKAIPAFSSALLLINPMNLFTFIAFPFQHGLIKYFFTNLIHVARPEYSKSNVHHALNLYGRLFHKVKIILPFQSRSNE